MAIKNCHHFLKREIEVVSPQSIIAFGQKPLRALAEVFSMTFPSTLKECVGKTWDTEQYTLAATYFPGNNRHNGFDSIVNTIQSLLDE